MQIQSVRILRVILFGRSRDGQFPHKWLTSHLANLTESIASHFQVLVIRHTAAGTQRGAADADCVKLTELRMKDDGIEERMSMVASQLISPASTRRLLQQQAVYM